VGTWQLTDNTKGDLEMRQLLVAGLVTLGLVTATPAHADVSDYLAFMRNHGIPGQADSLTQAGIQACEKLNSGMTPMQVTSSFLQHGMDQAKASDVVAGAQQYLCGQGGVP
jgi:hypothetical protein